MGKFLNCIALTLTEYEIEFCTGCGKRIVPLKFITDDVMYTVTYQTGKHIEVYQCACGQPSLREFDFETHEELVTDYHMGKLLENINDKIAERRN